MKSNGGKFVCAIFCYTTHKTLIRKSKSDEQTRGEEGEENRLSVRGEGPGRGGSGLNASEGPSGALH